MTPTQLQTVSEAADEIRRLIAQGDLPGASAVLTPLAVPEVVELVDRLPNDDAAIVYRLLAKTRALAVFEALSPGTRGDLVQALRNVEITALFAEMDPDDRVWLLDELPASVAPQLLRGLTRQERDLTSGMLGYPQDSIGRRMSPEFVTTHPQLTVRETFARIRAALDSAETVYTVPVTDARRVVGVVSLRDLMSADEDAVISDVMNEPHVAEVTENAETTARRATDYSLLALPVVDGEQRLVGILTIDDAARILKQEESEDAARQGGVEPLRRSYLGTPIRQLVRSRVVWLLVLAVGATLTVQVLDTFEATLAQMTVLALFVPLLIGTGGNTGNQAATTVTRSLALGEVSPRDVLRVLSREIRVGFCLGLLLGTLGFVIAGLIYEWHVGLVIGLTLVAVCTVAASVGGMMPLAARAIRVDPAVFSNPFITTFVDATGLVIYFLIAKTVLGL
ncbi:magnesium transporter [Microbacterium arabinogalactanolyticum]|uniref:magnesium transporter n=1 Tax=Microbacterium arabinogalactanolyticum TaxID=69365 RepID=UPI0025542F95|nr:magnesium transporter [Microbacterium arabinogalactanolyticum]GLC86754.1 magnesium transporter MgtE [Microbacterium arabinogalactanolyticum]